MVDNGIGQLHFRKIKKAGSAETSEDRLQAAIRASENRERKPGELFVRGSGEPEHNGEPGTGGWTIVLRSLTDKEAAFADQALKIVRQDVPEAVLTKRGAAAFVTVGNFESAESPAALSELKRVQELEVGGLRPYASALLAAPEKAVARTSIATSDLDLRKVVASLGEKEIRYTLQVAIYGRPDRAIPEAGELAQFRAKAEEAVRVLRKDGEEAYVLHTPRQSIVTVGVFGTKDIQGEESADVVAARKRHPHLLLNGEGVKVRSSGTDGALQPTQIVEIPRK